MDIYADQPTRPRGTRCCSDVQPRLDAAEAQRLSEPLRQDWAGALRDHRQTYYTSLDLQHQASDWTIKP